MKEWIVYMDNAYHEEINVTEAHNIDGTVELETGCVSILQRLKGTKEEAERACEAEREYWKEIQYHEFKEEIDQY